MQKKRYAQKSKETKEIAHRRIEKLFILADKNALTRPDLSKRYVELARTIGMKVKVRIPSSLKKRYCRHCLSYFVPGKTTRVRIREGILVIYCLVCKKFSRYPLTPTAKTHLPAR
ncbi:MAG: ribonuclease P protein component 4 [Nanoarchaeota archaeon]